MPGAGTKLLEATEQRGAVRAYRLSRTYPYVVVAFEHAEQLVVAAIHQSRCTGDAVPGSGHCVGLLPSLPGEAGESLGVEDL